MKIATRLLGLGLAATCAASGCKTPQLAWWKSSPATESTAVAHSAPVSPATLAKNEAAHDDAPAASSSQIARGTADPFIANQPAAATAPSSYPSTSAPAFRPQQVAAAAASGSAGGKTQADKLPRGAANLGSLPYDPNKAPTTSIAAEAPKAPKATSRYGIPASDSDRYQAAADPTTTLTSPTPSPPNAGRYGGMAAAGSSSPASTSSPPGQLPAMPPAVQVAASEPYRPGGTTSYPNSASTASLEVASRPHAPEASTTNTIGGDPAGDAANSSGRYR